MFAPVGILFTIFATVGVVNAFNLIDGLNGLSSYVTASVAVSLSIISFQAGNTQISIFLVLVVAAVLGFMALNFPMGKIFLGDGGAYTLGHLLVWSAIILINSAAEISAFAILLVFFWPVADTGLAIWRRWKLATPLTALTGCISISSQCGFLNGLVVTREQLQTPCYLILIPMISAPQVLSCFGMTLKLLC